jgi:aminoglycoside 6'-N-acetyltransferase I
VRITDLTCDDQAALRQAAELLVDLLDWPSLDAALEEVRACVEPGKIARVAVAGETVLGWIGGQRYESDIWELHPLVVREEHQRLGIGRRLVADLEERMRVCGVTAVVVGGDVIRDEAALAPLAAYSIELAGIVASLRRSGVVPLDIGACLPQDAYQHTFYERCGYVIVGIVPIENAAGNVYMAKEIRQSHQTLSSASNTICR